MTEIRSIDAVYEKGAGRDYTDDGLLYQDILRYCIEECSHNRSVKIYELSNWLLRNNRELISTYDSTSRKRNTRYSARIHAHRTRIENKVKDLIKLGLMESRGTIKGDKNDFETPLYSYTKTGYLLASIIRSSLLDKIIASGKRKKVANKMEIIKTEKEQRIVNTQIFTLLDSSFLKITEDSSSTVVFYSAFFRKCKDNGFFDDLVRHAAAVAHSNKNVRDVQALIEHVMDLGLTNKKVRKELMDLWNNTLEGLDEKFRALALFQMKLNAESRLALFQMKLNAESRFQNKRSSLSKEYEEMRFTNRNDYQRIVVEGECQKCGIGPVALPFLEYRKRFAAVAPNGPIRLDCPRCNISNNLFIPNFNP